MRSAAPDVTAICSNMAATADEVIHSDTALELSCASFFEKGMLLSSRRSDIMVTDQGM